MKSLNITFVLPTKNEENTVENIIQTILKMSQLNNWSSTIVLVDDSTDRTSEIASKYNVKIISGESKGLGYAMLKGLAYARITKPDCIVSLDTDGQVELQEISFFIDQFITGKYEVLLSSRFLSTQLIQYQYPIINFFGNRILVYILRICTGFRFTDSHGGIRVMKPHTIDDLSLIGQHTYVQETLIHYCKNGYQIIELPSQWKPRRYSSSRVLHSITQYVLRTLPALLYLMNFHWIILIIMISATALQIFTQNFNLTLTGLTILLSLLLMYIYSTQLKKINVRDFINE